MAIPKGSKPADPNMTPPPSHKKLMTRLRAERDALARDLDQANARIAELLANGAAETPIRWIRGKLPGERLIKTDTLTGTIKEIGREEWDTLN